MMMVQPAGDDRRFIAEQSGLVRILGADGKILEEPFLDLTDRITPQWPQFDEKGLLGLAFHPDFASNGKFYVLQPADPLEGDLAKHFWWSHTNVIEEYTVSADDPDVADRAACARSRRSTGRSSITTAIGSPSVRTAFSTS